MEAKAKERLHRLVDRVPEEEVHTAERFLEYLATSEDPVMRALMNAPEDDEPLTDADREALEEGRRALEAGEVVSHEELRKAIGL
jgi:predicted transcriptional regulator